MLSTWIKARAWQNPVMINYLSYTGNVPLASRGYVISGDFKQLFGRKPSNDEYRALRDHLDEGSPLPEGEVFDQLQNQARSILGEDYSPSQSTYRQAIESCFKQFMESSLIVAERLIVPWPKHGPAAVTCSSITSKLATKLPTESKLWISSTVNVTAPNDLKMVNVTMTFEFSASSAVDSFV